MAVTASKVSIEKAVVVEWTNAECPFLCKLFEDRVGSICIEPGACMYCGT
jgi:hypothetical protein